MPITCSDICKVIFAVILPPLGVFLEVGCEKEFWIDILLTLLGYLPGKITLTIYFVF
jgi:uncharacterized membrane protein YqaE (UPF0057 family)